MYSTFLKIMQIQINITLRFLFTLARLTRANKRTDNKFWHGYVERYHCWCVFKLVPPLWKSSWVILKKLKVVLPYDSSYITPCYIPKVSYLLV